ncbi:MAG: hypothetical protein IJ572_05060 [Bacilli bacterium]|nr:hypothetical protein [Bacilli bacterium]
MNLDKVKEEISSLVNKEVMVNVSGSRNKRQMYKGIINNVYSNIFTVLIEGVNKSFTYSDVAIGDVKIYHV